MTRAPIDPSSLEPVTRPLDQARTLPGAAYASPDVFEWERRHFLDGSWLCVGRADDVPAPGDQRAVAAGSTSLLLVRDGDGALRGWFNVCRHRGHELLAPGASRKGRAIRCPYHDWVYGLGGECRATPRFGKSTDDGIDRAEFGLVPARVEQWHGWVFANVSGDAPPLAEQLGNAGMVVDGYDAQRLVLGARHEYEVAANWKVIVENYLECYHCAPIHPELCEVTPPESGAGYPAAPAGSWVGGPLALRDGVQTMSLDGRSLGVPIPGLPADQDPRGRVRGAAADAAGQPAPGLPDDAPAGAAGRGPDPGRVRLVLPARGVAPARLRPGVRGRLLGPGQPAGLGRLRVGAAQRELPRLAPGPVLPLGVRRPRGHVRGRPRLRAPAASGRSADAPTRTRPRRGGDGALRLRRGSLEEVGRDPPVQTSRARGLRGPPPT